MATFVGGHHHQRLTPCGERQLRRTLAPIGVGADDAPFKSPPKAPARSPAQDVGGPRFATNGRPPRCLHEVVGWEQPGCAEAERHQPLHVGVATCRRHCRHAVVSAAAVFLPRVLQVDCHAGVVDPLEREADQLECLIVAVAARVLEAQRTCLLDRVSPQTVNRSMRQSPPIVPM